MAKVNPNTWQRYKNTINAFHDDANQQVIVWHKSQGGLDRFGEDNLTERFLDINLLGLIQYNYFRSWPMTKTTETGELDEQNSMLIFNRKYLEDLGYLNLEGYFAFDPAADRFTIEGKVYKASGDTPLSQASDEPLLVMIVVQREELNT